MESVPNVNDSVLQAARQYRALGYRTIPLIAGGKKAVVKWKRYQTEDPTEAEIETWFSAGEPNVAILTGNGVVVVDIDDPLLAKEAIAQCGDTPMKCRTPRNGMHFWYSESPGVVYGNFVRINDRAIDLRWKGAHICVPPSRTENGIYQWAGRVLRPEELPPLPPNPLIERKPRSVMPSVAPSDSFDVMVRRARAYLSRIEGAVAGEGGHDKTFRVACVLTQKFRLSFEQAWPLLCEYNRHCEPEWSEPELRHKLEDSLKAKQ